jgi:ribosomal protein L31
MCLWKHHRDRFHQKDIKVVVCSKCTSSSGKQKLVDTGGRVQPLQQEFGLDK